MVICTCILVCGFVVVPPLDRRWLTLNPNRLSLRRPLLGNPLAHPHDFGKLIQPASIITPSGRFLAPAPHHRRQTARSLIWLWSQAATRNQRSARSASRMICSPQRLAWQRSPSVVVKHLEHEKLVVMTADDAADLGSRHRDTKRMRVASCREGLACCCRAWTCYRAKACGDLTDVR